MEAEEIPLLGLCREHLRKRCPDMSDRTAVCVDCGQTIQIASKGRPARRCEPCQTTHDREYRRTYMQGRRKEKRSERAPKACLECGKAFEISQGNGRYCSEDCGRTARLRRRNETEYLPDPINCVQCGQPVPYKSGRRRFCTDECRATFVAADARWKTKGITADGHGLPEHCGICEKADRTLVIDHDHRCCPGQRSCGKCVRGLLCRQCNGALGMFLDDPELLHRAAAYVERMRSTSSDLNALA